MSLESMGNDQLLIEQSKAYKERVSQFNTSIQDLNVAIVELEASPNFEAVVSTEEAAEIQEYKDKITTLIGG